MVMSNMNTNSHQDSLGLLKLSAQNTENNAKLSVSNFNDVDAELVKQQESSGNYAEEEEEEYDHDDGDDIHIHSIEKSVPCTASTVAARIRPNKKKRCKQQSQSSRAWCRRTASRTSARAAHERESAPTREVGVSPDQVWGGVFKKRTGSFSSGISFLPHFFCCASACALVRP